MCANHFFSNPTLDYKTYVYGAWCNVGRAIRRYQVEEKHLGQSWSMCYGSNPLLSSFCAYAHILTIARLAFAQTARSRSASSAFWPNHMIPSICAWYLCFLLTVAPGSDSFPERRLSSYWHLCFLSPSWFCCYFSLSQIPKSNPRVRIAPDAYSVLQA